MATLAGIPRADGYRMPGEFEPHARTWMVWPERPDNWRENAGPAQQAYAAVAEAIGRFEPTTMCASSDQWETARAALSERVRVVEMSSDDAWMRDQGPTFVKNGHGHVRGVHWGFNAWGGLSGGCYASWEKDELIGHKVLELENLDRYRNPMILEGGSIDVDGQGILMTTEECLLNPNRNPQLSRGDIEGNLRDYLGIRQVVWLPRGVYGDTDTDGHVDNLCRFVRPGVVVLTWTDDPRDPQHEISRAAEDVLKAVVNPGGERLEIHRLHQPNPLLITPEESAGVRSVEGTAPREAGTRLPASYVNFYVVNGAVIVPAFGDARDSEAAARLGALFIGREIVPLPSREILLGGGNIHCITAQQPA